MKLIDNGYTQSADGHCWTVTIEHTVDDASKGELVRKNQLDMPADGIELEWKATARHATLCGSACSVTVCSEGYADWRNFYATSPGDVVLKLWRDGELYWQGVLDLETYAEPYDVTFGADVQLTFSDLGALRHLKFDLAADADHTLFSLLCTALERAGLPAVIEHCYEIADAAGHYFRLYDVSVNGSNFYDEDSNPVTWADVLESVLFPLGLRIVQTPGGKFTVYDIPHRYSRTYRRDIIWSATGQSLSVDKVYKTVELTFSPYGSAKAVTGRIDYDSVEFQALDGENTIYTDQLPDAWPGFKVEWGKYKDGAEDLIFNPNFPATVGKITKIYSGQESAFVVGALWPSKASDNPMQYLPAIFPRGVVRWTGPGGPVPRQLFAAKPVRLLRRPDMMRIKLGIMLDGRYNPFEDADDNCRSQYDQQQKHILAAVPARIYITAPDGTQYWWKNNNIDHPAWQRVIGNDGTPGYCWLTFYSWNKNEGKCIGGTITNKHSAGAPDSVTGGKVSQRRLDLFQLRGDGEFVDMPPIAGTLSVEIFDGVAVYDNKGRLVDDLNNSGCYGHLYWLLYNSLDVDLCDRHGNTLNDEDISYKIEIDNRRADTLALDTTCGSAVDAPANARGLYIYHTKPLTTIQRPGRISGSVEAMQLALTASQYAERSHTLRGQIYADDIYKNAFTMIAPFADRALPDTSFLCTSAVYNILAGTVDADFCQIKPVTFNPNEDVTQN